MGIRATACIPAMLTHAIVFRPMLHARSDVFFQFRRVFNFFYHTWPERNSETEVTSSSLRTALRFPGFRGRRGTETMGMFGDFFGGPHFNASKCKTALRLCLGRVKLLRNKKANALVIMRRDIADLLVADKHDSAAVRVEAVLREEALLDAFELLDLHCELLVVRLPLIVGSTAVPEDLRQAVATVVFCAKRIGGEIPELNDIKNQFVGKYGTQYVTACADVTTAGACGVHALAIGKLAVAAPTNEARINALEKIAVKHCAKFDKKDFATRNDSKTETTTTTTTNAQYADAGAAAFAARAAASEAAAAADAAARFADHESGAKTAGGVSSSRDTGHARSEHTVGVITSASQLPPPGFLIDPSPFSNENGWSVPGKSVTEVAGGDRSGAEFDDCDVPAAVTGDEESKKEASEPSKSPVITLTQPAPDYARPYPPPGIGGGVGGAFDAAASAIGSPPDGAGADLNETETATPLDVYAGNALGDDKIVDQNEDAAEQATDPGDEVGEDFDALAVRLAALKRGGDE
jgi:hypothetical protein